MVQVFYAERNDFFAGINFFYFSSSSSHVRINVNGMKILDMHTSLLSLLSILTSMVNASFIFVLFI